MNFANRSRLLRELEAYHYQFEYTHSVGNFDIKIPMVYKALSSFMLFFPVTISAASQYLDSSLLRLVTVLPKTTLLAINIFEYRDSPVGPFNEFTFSLPVVTRSRRTPPFLPLIFNQRYKNFGFYVIQLGASNDIGRKHITEIWGYPTYQKNLKISLNHVGGHITASIYDHDAPVFTASEYVPENKKLKLQKKKFNTYFACGDSLRNVQLDSILFAQTLIRSRTFNFEIGNHYLSQILRNLKVKSKVATIFYSDGIEIAGKARPVI